MLTSRTVAKSNGILFRLLYTIPHEVRLRRENKRIGCKNIKRSNGHKKPETPEVVTAALITTVLGMTTSLVAVCTCGSVTNSCTVAAASLVASTKDWAFVSSVGAKLFNVFFTAPVRDCKLLPTVASVLITGVSRSVLVAVLERSDSANGSPSTAVSFEDVDNTISELSAVDQVVLVATLSPPYTPPPELPLPLFEPLAG